MEFPSFIKIASLSVQHILEVNTTETGEQILNGVEGRLLRTLAKSLNFQYKHMIPSDNILGLKGDNGNWSGVMGMLQRKEADFGMCGIAMLFDRLEVADFSKVFKIQRLSFLVEKPGSLPAVWAFVRIFDTVLWGIIIFVVFVAPLICSFLLNHKFSVIDLVVQFFGSISRQPLEFQMTSTRSRIFITSWLVFALVISSSYSACLLSYLSLPLQGKPITTFIDLSRAVRKGTHKSVMLKGAPSVYLLTKSGNEDLEFLGKTVLDNNWFYLPSQGIETSTVEGNTAIINADFALKLLLGKLPPGSFLISEDSLISFKFGIALRKGFCCTERLNTVLSRVLAAGLIDKYQRDEWNIQSFENCHNFCGKIKLLDNLENSYRRQEKGFESPT
ncbi:glutamate receptor ionotropic, delta-1-like [Argiope bruennichi]|uniref:glutamate receptor ionotropic, delta-1-like n=1 Tax=Argiope bruennichi TaxID=94029 RepID=UPI0024941A85|nr:glutamate receptor ionotropic, delta-1-like [Argiope bruennichi]